MKLTAKLALAALSLGLAAPAFAEAVDVATLTCEGMATMDKETGTALLMWMDGYTGGSVEDTSFDPDRLNTNIADTVAACEADPTRSVLEVMKEVSIAPAE